MSCLPKKKRQKEWQPGARLWRCLKPFLQRRGGSYRGWTPFQRDKGAAVDVEPAPAKVKAPVGGEVEDSGSPAPASNSASQHGATTPKISKLAPKRVAKHTASYEEAVRHSTRKATAADVVLENCWPNVLSKLSKYTAKLGNVVPASASNGKMKLNAPARRIALAASARDAARLLESLDASNSILSVPKSLRVACDTLVAADQVVQCWNHIKAALARADANDLVLWLEQAEGLGLDINPERDFAEYISEDPRASKRANSCRASPLKGSPTVPPRASGNSPTPPVCRAATTPPRQQSPSPSADVRSDQSTTARSERNSDRNSTPNTTPRVFVPADGSWAARPQSYRRMQSEPPGRPERPQSAQPSKSGLPRQTSKDRPPRPQSARPSAPPPPPPPHEAPPPPTHPSATSSKKARGTERRAGSPGCSAGPCDTGSTPPPQPSVTPPRGRSPTTRRNSPTFAWQERESEANNGSAQAWDDGKRARTDTSAPSRPATPANPGSTGVPFRSPRGSEKSGGAAGNADQTPQRPQPPEQTPQRPRPPPMPKSNQESPGAPTSRPGPKVGASPRRPSATSSSPPPRPAPSYTSSPGGSSAGSNSECGTPREPPNIGAQKPFGSSSPRQLSIREQQLQALDFEINANPTEAELKAAYRQAALRWHPDRQHNSADPKGAAEHFKAARAAYDYFLARAGSPASRGGG